MEALQQIVCSMYSTAFILVLFPYSAMMLVFSVYLFKAPPRKTLQASLAVVCSFMLLAIRFLLFDSN